MRHCWAHCCTVRNVVYYQVWEWGWHLMATGRPRAWLTTATRWGSRGYGSRWGRRWGERVPGHCGRTRRTTWWCRRSPSGDSRTPAGRRHRTCWSPRRARWTLRWRTADSSAVAAWRSRSRVAVRSDAFPSEPPSTPGRAPTSRWAVRPSRDHTASSSLSAGTRRPHTTAWTTDSLPVKSSQQTLLNVPYTTVVDSLNEDFDCRNVARY